MDPIESMLRSINPVPDETSGPVKLGLPPGLDLSTAPRAAASNTAAALAHRPAPKRRTSWFTTARVAVVALAAVVVVAAAGFFGAMTQGWKTPEPAAPLPSPSSIPPTSAPTSTAPPSAPPAAPAMDPATGITCTFENVATTDQAGQMLENMGTHPGDFNVLGCAGGWLAFELTDGGYQRLVDQGAGTGSGDGNGKKGDFYFAKFDGSKYLYNKYYFVQGWNTIQTAGGTAADKAAEMDNRIERLLGIASGLRQALVGEPVSTPATTAPTTNSSPNVDPETGVACSMDNVAPADNPEAWVMKDIAAHPENYTVLGCAGGWLSFKLSDAGYQRWLDDFKTNGLIQENSEFFYFGKYNGSSYQFKLGQSVPNWTPRPGVDPRPAAMVKTMAKEMEQAGIPATLREALVGSPPS
ncbi:hypothetical protein [Arthrobacter sp.]|uniref:hypothetical protein n=1 Tax=Arthrobacter sp. TaxID=1667 RepID=UPI0026DF8C2C|nr:hypothetical protein [Arthrobacter sp.]MDO5752297.1 hypothetical protein [Arthrobacter sp.]